MTNRRNLLIAAGAALTAAPVFYFLGKANKIPIYSRWSMRRELTGRLQTILGPVEGRDAIAAFLEGAPNLKSLHEMNNHGLATQFLMSTDYFDQERPAQAAIAYIGHYDPLDSACVNPMARFELA